MAGDEMFYSKVRLVLLHTHKTKDALKTNKTHTHTHTHTRIKYILTVARSFGRNGRGNPIKTTSECAG